MGCNNCLKARTGLPDGGVKLLEQLTVREKTKTGNSGGVAGNRFSPRPLRDKTRSPQIWGINKAAGHSIVRFYYAVHCSTSPPPISTDLRKCYFPLPSRRNVLLCFVQFCPKRLRLCAAWMSWGVSPQDFPKFTSSLSLLGLK